MSSGQIVALMLAAVLVFWMLGAYNRLVRMRNAIGRAWTACEPPLQQRAGATAALLEALREPLAAEAPTLQAVAVAQAQLEQAMRTLKSSPVSADAAAEFSVAMAALEAGLARLVSLCEHASALQELVEVTDSLAALREARIGLTFGRELYNAAVSAYNKSLAESPTRLLVGLYRFGPAGRI
jgi:LemA protein